MKATHAYPPFIQEEMDELLTKGAIKPCTGCDGFYSNIFVIPKHMGGLHPYSTLSNLITLCTLHYLHIPIVKHHHHFLWFVWEHKSY